MIKKTSFLCVIGSKIHPKVKKILRICVKKFCEYPPSSSEFCFSISAFNYRKLIAFQLIRFLPSLIKCNKNDFQWKCLFLLLFFKKKKRKCLSIFLLPLKNVWHIMTGNFLDVAEICTTFHRAWMMQSSVPKKVETDIGKITKGGPHFPRVCYLRFRLYTAG